MRRLILLSCLALPSIVLAQAPRMTTDQPVQLSVPAAAPADVDSIDAIVDALYDVISGPPGQARDWARFRSLFVPTARMIPVGLIPTGTAPSGAHADAAHGLRLMGPNDYIASSGPLLLDKGFHERELARRVEQFGHIAQVFSSYEARIVKDDHTMRGINSIQLMNDGKRWWIMSLMWEAESDKLKLPAQFLK